MSNEDVDDHGSDLCVLKKAVMEDVNSHSHAVFEPHINKKDVCCAVWHELQNMAEITVMKGKFWRVMGIIIDSKPLLFPEESLHLVERGFLTVQYKDSLANIPFVTFYAAVMSCIPLSCYFTFSKLKELQYIVTRYNAKKSTLMSFCGDESMEALTDGHTTALLDKVASFAIYVNSKKWSKSKVKECTAETRCVGYVVVMEGDMLFNGSIVCKLMQEAEGVPVVLSMVKPSGLVSLHEFCDAELSLGADFLSNT